MLDTKSTLIPQNGVKKFVYRNNFVLFCILNTNFNTFYHTKVIIYVNTNTKSEDIVALSSDVLFRISRFYTNTEQGSQRLAERTEFQN